MSKYTHYTYGSKEHILYEYTYTPTYMRSTIPFEEQLRFNTVFVGKIFILGISYVNLMWTECVMNRFSTMESMNCTRASDNSYVLLWLYPLPNVHFSPFLFISETIHVKCTVPIGWLYENRQRLSCFACVLVSVTATKILPLATPP